MDDEAASSMTTRSTTSPEALPLNGRFWPAHEDPIAQTQNATTMHNGLMKGLMKVLLKKQIAVVMPGLSVSSCRLKACKKPRGIGPAASREHPAQIRPLKKLLYLLGKTTRRGRSSPDFP